jgi:small subunit ribosomal protein S17
VIILELQKKQERPLSTRGRVFKGTVVSTKMAKTATVEWDRREYIPKYERYEKKRTKIHAHIPSELKVEEGDVVKIMETRPISKTKTTLVIENLTKNISLMSLKKDLIEKNKIKKDKD